MKKLRWLGAAGAAGLALALVLVGSATAGSAIASYQSAKLDVSGPTKLGAKGTVTIHVVIASTDDPTAKATIYAPRGYSASLSAPSGAQVGTLDAKVIAADLAGATLPVSGTITLADASAVVTVSGAQIPITTLAAQCTGTPTHAAYLVLNLSAGGQSIQVPVFADPAAGSETAFASFKLQLCLGPPDVPAGTPGRATFGIKLIEAKLNLTSVFTNPTTAAPYLWSAFLTPYTPATGTANAAATIEIRSAVLLPVKLTLKGKYDKKKKAAVLSGTLAIGGLADISGIAPFIFSGPKATQLKAAGRTGKTSKSGAFTATKKIKKTTYFAVALGINPADDTAEVCQGASLAPGGCVSGTIGGFGVVSNIVKVTVPKKKK